MSTTLEEVQLLIKHNYGMQIQRMLMPVIASFSDVKDAMEYIPKMEEDGNSLYKRLSEMYPLKPNAISENDFDAQVHTLFNPLHDIIQRAERGFGGSRRHGSRRHRQKHRKTKKNHSGKKSKSRKNYK